MASGIQRVMIRRRDAIERFEAVMLHGKGQT
jgi:hypothetical protein